MKVSDKPGRFGSAQVKQLYRSVWFFPAILTVALVLATALRISGSSVGVYHSYFYGDTKDVHLLFGKPRNIRSDEWLVNTQMTLAQQNNDQPRINQDIGDGQDMSVILDVPYREWSTLFKPQNWSFFVLPFDFALAFKWWFMAYLLLVSCYLFVLALLPRQRMLASLVSLALLFSPFIQWWYQYITLGPLYYCLFIATGLLHMAQAHSRKHLLLLAGLIAYALACFGLVLYPPFQIACAIILAAWFAGLAIHLYLTDRRGLRQVTLWGGSAAIVATAIVGCFLLTRSSVVSAAQNTAYPGKRVVASGGYNPAHLFSGHLSFQQLYTGKAANYQLPKQGLTNQSETSNFILLLPYVVIANCILLYTNYRKHRHLDPMLTVLTITFVALMARMFIPAFDPLFKVLQLDKVPHNRLLIGIGLLNFVSLAYFIKHYTSKDIHFSNRTIYGLSALALLVPVSLSLYAHHTYQGYIGSAKAFVLALPIGISMYLLLRRRIVLGLVLYAAFSIVSSLPVNPLYYKASSITVNHLSDVVRQAHQQSPSSRWATDDIFLENYSQMLGVPSLSGVYTYPQKQLWSTVVPATSEATYNRYAHVGLLLDTDVQATIPTELQLAGPDHFVMKTEPCGAELAKTHVDYLLTQLPLHDNCLTTVDAVVFPARTIFVYKIQR